MRAENRHNRQKKIAAAERWAELDQWGLDWGETLSPPYIGLWGKWVKTPEDLERAIRKKAITPQSCSSGDHGHRCNPRKRGEGDPYRDKKRQSDEE